MQGKPTNEIWFGPYQHTPFVETDHNNFVAFNGSVDYLQLFTHDELWAQARSGIDVFKVNSGWAFNFVNDSTLSFMISKLNSWGVKVAFEEGALQNDTCGGFEGMGLGTEDQTLDLQRFKRLGGNVTYIDMDSPYWAGTTTNEPNSCGWTAEYTAYQVNRYIEAAHKVFPKATIGEIEVVQRGVDVKMVENWMETYKAVTGHYLPYLHLDNCRVCSGWEEMAAELQVYANQRGVRFGMPYYSDSYYTSDKQWYEDVLAGVMNYEVKHHMRPDDAVFQSWTPWPRYVLPEDANYTYTHLLRVYERQRTYISMNPTTTSGQLPVLIDGALKNVSGDSVGGSTVTISARSLSRAAYHTYTVTGTFPIGTVYAVMGVNLNVEYGCQGLNDFRLYNVTLKQGTSPVNIAPNYDFTGNSINGGDWEWSTTGNGTAEVIPSDLGDGRMIHLATNTTNWAGFNSGGIPVTAGLNYTATFGAKVGPDSSGCGDIVVSFLGGEGGTVWTGRDSVFPETSSTIVGSDVTDTEGVFSYSYNPSPNDTYAVSVCSAGDQEHWPVCQEFQADIGGQSTIRFSSVYQHSMTFAVPYNGENPVLILTNSSNVYGFIFSQQGKSVRFIIDGTHGTQGFLHIVIPSSLLGGPFTASLDGASWPFEQNSTPSGVNLTLRYTHSAHTITIFAASVAQPSTTTSISTSSSPASTTSTTSASTSTTSATSATSSSSIGKSTGFQTDYLPYVLAGALLAIVGAASALVLKKRR